MPDDEDWLPLLELLALTELLDDDALPVDPLPDVEPDPLTDPLLLLLDDPLPLPDDDDEELCAPCPLPPPPLLLDELLFVGQPPVDHNTNERTAKDCVRIRPP